MTGAHVVVATRSGSGPESCERVVADASDNETMVQLAEGVRAIYNCVNPPYDQWASQWPPIRRSLLAAATKSGAVLVTISNLYAYGPACASLGVDAYDLAHPMKESTPLAALGTKGRVRAQRWNDAHRAFEAGEAKVTEILVRPTTLVPLPRVSSANDSYPGSCAPRVSTRSAEATVPTPGPTPKTLPAWPSPRQRMSARGAECFTSRPTHRARNKTSPMTSPRTRNPRG